MAEGRKLRGHKSLLFVHTKVIGGVPSLLLNRLHLEDRDTPIEQSGSQ